MVSSLSFAHPRAWWPRHVGTCFNAFQSYRHSCACFETLFISPWETLAHAAGILNCQAYFQHVLTILGWIALASTCNRFSYILRASRSLAKTGLCWGPLFAGFPHWYADFWLPRWMQFRDRCPKGSREGLRHASGTTWEPPEGDLG